MASTPRERLDELAKLLKAEGFRVDIREESIYVETDKSDIVLTDLPREFIEEVLRAGYKELVLVAGKTYYYFHRNDLEKVLQHNTS